ncbi:ADP-ribosylglycohydrolase family protein [Nonomuraea sp. NPDC050663]|uniref:ADP-ribosylglycohydrolase family protein n=1 Tax=Nonomuraea sp. NPDC050663 TaxID=3364370 RepID=UPI0037B00308
MDFPDRVRGCLLGGAIGDALGAPIEFESLREIRKNHGISGIESYVPDWRGQLGLITDDTQMTLFTVEGLLAGGDPVHEVRQAYLRWLDTQQHRTPPPPVEPWRTGALREQGWLYSRRAPGNACLSGLRRTLTHDPYDTLRAGAAGDVNPASKGCGTVMRSAPFGLVTADPRAAFELSAACAQITHGHPTGYLAAGAFAAIITLVTGGEPLFSAVEGALELTRSYPAHEETTAALEHAVELAAAGIRSPEAVESLGGAWVAEEALAISVYCALVTGGAVTAALLLSVNHSGDSDSTGSLTGNLLGAALGQEALPAPWLSPLEGRQTITELADRLAEVRRG